MTKKSQRGKRLARSKRREGRQHLSVASSQQPATVQNYEPVSPLPTPSTKVLRPRSKLTLVQYPYITTELRRIAILAGIMLVALVVLYFAIP